MEEPSQFSVRQTAKILTCSIMDKPHTGLDDCLNMILACLRAKMSDLIIPRRISWERMLQSGWSCAPCVSAWGRASCWWRPPTPRCSPRSCRSQACSRSNQQNLGFLVDLGCFHIWCPKNYRIFFTPSPLSLSHSRNLHYLRLLFHDPPPFECIRHQWKSP